MKRLTLSLLFVSIGLLYAPTTTTFTTKHNRKEAIKSLLHKYKRPITVLFIGEESDYWGCKVAKRYNAVSVILESKKSKDYLKVCKEHDHGNKLILLSKKMSAKDVKRLGECEHFDVVIALNPFSQFESSEEHVIDSLLELGNYIFIEAPEKYAHYLEKKKGVKKSGQDKQVLFLFSREKDHLQRRRWNYGIQQSDTYKIESTFDKKTFIKEKKQPHGTTVTPWSPGINLLTFKILGGIYPEKKTVYSAVSKLDTVKHNDFKIFNLIIQGKNLVPIDCDEPGRRTDAKHGIPHVLNYFKRLPFCPFCDDEDDDNE